MAISKIPMQGFSEQGINFRNIIINGDMTQSQRGSDINDVAHQGYCADRFRFHKANTGELVMNFDQVTDVPSSQGFSNSLKLSVGTVESATASNELVGIGQRIEAQNLQYLKYGTSSAETLTLSFWVKSSVTGTYAAFMFQQDASSSPDRRYYSKTFTISSADTWEKKTIQITGNQDDVITNDNGIGLDFRIILSAGSSLTSGSSGAWGSSTNSAVGQTANFSGTSSATFFLTGVQLEVGTTPSDFEFLPVDVNLKRCQRYYQTLGYGHMAIHESGTTYVMNLPHIQTMRSVPSKGLNISSNLRVRQFGTSDRDASSPSISSSNGSNNGSYIKVTGFGSVGSTSSVAGVGYTTSSEDGDAFKLDAEL
jgi:hypothetical protein